MSKKVRVAGIKRKEIDQEKLALAFLLMAKRLHDQNKVEPEDGRAGEVKAA